MNNENYLNYYVEILTNTMSEAVIKNISLQANGKVSDEVIKALSKKIDDLEQERTLKNNVDSSKITQLENTINELRTELSKLNVMKGDFESAKSQIQHIETFKNELLKAREEIKNLHTNYGNQIKELNEKIEYLQLTPAKRKKLDESKGVVEQPKKEEKVEEEKPEVQKPKTLETLGEVKEKVTLPEVFKDGGSF